ncbi:hypothetical protein [Sorangium sp. So ce131]|uniref:hypothetical protein n=1 Tax=Sorangium sp. So ce131 TaxID=3133282 RepID=UPI003F5EAE30
MSADGLWIAVACEDAAHHALATFLADRVLLDEAGRRGATWIDEAQLRHLRHYCGLEGAAGAEPYYPLSRASKDIDELGRMPQIGGRPVRLNGHMHGRPLQPEASLWRRLFVLFGSKEPPPSAVIVVCDTDGYPQRLDGLKQAIAFMSEEFPHPLRIIAAMPDQDAEAWFVAGFVPQGDAERRRLRELLAALKFDPTEEPHRLTARPNDSPADAKRVLRVLLVGEHESRPPAMSELPTLCERTLEDLALLERRGALCGLCDFLGQLRTLFVPLFIPGPPPLRG